MGCAWVITAFTVDFQPQHKDMNATSAVMRGLKGWNLPMIDPCQYIFINQGLRMSAGKIAAQAGHAAVEGYRLTDPDSNALRLWFRSGHYKKIVLAGRDEGHMRNIKLYLDARDIACAPIIDEGRTEIMPLTFTAIGCEILDKGHPHYAGIFSVFDLYKDVPDPAELARVWGTPSYNGKLPQWLRRS
jgi:peptidyl-tRNA hydrolase